MTKLNKKWWQFWKKSPLEKKLSKIPLKGGMSNSELGDIAAAMRDGERQKEEKAREDYIRRMRANQTDLNIYHDSDWFGRLDSSSDSSSSSISSPSSYDSGSSGGSSSSDSGSSSD